MTQEAAELATAIGRRVRLERRSRRWTLGELAQVAGVSRRALVNLGGEDLARYAGARRLVRANGEEPFDTVADGATAIEPPEVGEVVWCETPA